MMWLFGVFGLVVLGSGALWLMRHHESMSDVDHEAASFEIIE